jgi:hypothetical protein
MGRSSRAVLVVAGAIAFVAVALSASAGTKFNTTWKAPDAQPMTLKPGDKVIATVLHKDVSVRRGSEMSLVMELNKRGLTALPAYSIVPDEYMKDKEKAKALVEKTGAVAVVVLRVTGKDQEVTSTAASAIYMGPSYGTYWGGYYGFGWSMAYDPGYVRTETSLYVETLVYDLKQDKLVWAGSSSTTNPKRVDSLVRDIVGKVAGEIKKQGVIKVAK